MTGETGSNLALVGTVASVVLALSTWSKEEDPEAGGLGRMDEPLDFLNKVC